MRRRDWLGVGAIAAIAGLAVAAAAAVGGAIAGPFARTLAGSIAPGGPATGGDAAAAAGPPADDGAVVVGERFRAPRSLDLTIRSPALNGLGRVRLLLPPGWSRTATRTWPVLWLLHGGTGALGHSGHTAWTVNTDVEILTGDADVIVVMPDGGRCGNYTDWWNHGNGGPPKWETFHLTELRQILERGYRAGTARSIAGNSTGGAGALAYAARHRGLFRAAASFSGPLNTLYRSPTALDVPDLIQLGAGIGAPGGDWLRIWGDPVDQRTVWRQHNPLDLADRLSGVRLYVSAGEGDLLEALVRAVSQEFVARLRQLGIPVSAHFHEGGHSWPCWERELHAALPVLLAEIL